MSFISLCAQYQYKYLKLENDQFFFEAVYDGPDIGIEKMGQKLSIGIPRARNVTEVSKSGDVITAKIKNTLIDYKKYDGRWGKLPAFMNQPGIFLEIKGKNDPSINIIKYY